MEGHVRDGRLIVTRSSLAFFASMLLCLASLGCGTTSHGGGSTGATSSSTATSTQTHTITTSFIPPGQRLRGDGDADNPNDIDGNGDVDTTDKDNDYPVPESYEFPDADDKETFAFGHAANAATARAITSVVERYYADGSSVKGAAACALLLPTFAASVAEDYGQTGGPSFLRGGKSCPVVMSLLFRHLHAELSEAITVVGVRVQGDTAQAIFSSRKMPASHMVLGLQGNTWRLEQLIGIRLP